MKVLLNERIESFKQTKVMGSRKNVESRHSVFSTMTHLFAKQVGQIDDNLIVIAFDCSVEAVLVSVLVVDDGNTELDTLFDQVKAIGGDEFIDDAVTFTTEPGTNIGESPENVHVQVLIASIDGHAKGVVEVIPENVTISKLIKQFEKLDSKGRVVKKHHGTVLDVFIDGKEIAIVKVVGGAQQELDHFNVFVLDRLGQRRFSAESNIAFEVGVNLVENSNNSNINVLVFLKESHEDIAKTNIDRNVRRRSTKEQEVVAKESFDLFVGMVYKIFGLSDQRFQNSKGSKIFSGHIEPNKSEARGCAEKKKKKKERSFKKRKKF
ncbi:MAG: hypothetical protein BVN35_05955 [Proteobacteria bacterium ST_bin11]|nr:MAG: hypothetical protein BVN35_05955 [Proteobacteria bacterium ST_bin11]